MALASPWLQRQRMARVLPFLEPPLLDVGCGDCAAATHTHGTYVGVDRDRAPLPDGLIAMPPRMQASADRLPFRDGAFRTVLAMAVFEHVDDPLACLREALRVLEPSGRIVLTTPTPFGDRIHHVLARANITSKHAAAEHQSVMGPAELRGVVERAGFAIDHFNVFLMRGNQVCVGSRRAA